MSYIGKGEFFTIINPGNACFSLGNEPVVHNVFRKQTESYKGLGNL